MIYPYQNYPYQNQVGITFVQGENAAKSYPVKPNCRVWLMDSEAPRFYIKEVDAYGMPAPLRTFEFNEVQANEDVQNSAFNTKDMKSEEYVTKSELEAFKSEIMKEVSKNESIVPKSNDAEIATVQATGERKPARDYSANVK